MYGEWPKVSHPFERCHADFMYFRGKSFLIFIDVFSRWIDVKLMRNLTASTLIEKLEDIFGYFGYCKKLVTDNGPPFGSYEFKRFCDKYGIKLMHSPPYHPSSNGMAERAVQSIKKVLMKLVLDVERSNNSIDSEKLLKDLLRKQRNLPTTIDEIIPNHRLFSYKPRWEMDALKMEKSNESAKTTVRENLNHSKNSNVIVKSNLNRREKEIKKKLERISDFEEGDKIWYLSSQQGKIYRYEGIVVEKISNLRYKIRINGNIKISHINQLERKYERIKYNEISSNDFEHQVTKQNSDTTDETASKTKTNLTKRNIFELERTVQIVQVVRVSDNCQLEKEISQTGTIQAAGSIKSFIDLKGDVICIN